MSIAAVTETRVYDRMLEYTRENAMGRIFDNARDAKPLMSILTGKLAAPMFGGVGMSGKGKREMGGESIRVRTRLGQNLTMNDLAGEYAAYDTSPSRTVVHGRANWKLYGGTVNISEHEIQVQSGGHALSSVVEEEMEDGVRSLVDLVSTHLYTSGGIASRVTDLQTIVASNAAVHGLNGATYPRWNSRGVTARGTAPAAVNFTGGSWALVGLARWRSAWYNAKEGSEEPEAILTTHDVTGFYEGTLQPQERFNSPKMGDGGFEFLAYKTAPVIPDPDCVDGESYFLNFGSLFMAVLPGADFTSGPFQEPDAQRVRISKLFATCELVCTNRLLQNKVDTQTA